MVGLFRRCFNVAWSVFWVPAVFYLVFVKVSLETLADFLDRVVFCFLDYANCIVFLLTGKRLYNASEFQLSGDKAVKKKGKSPTFTPQSASKQICNHQMSTPPRHLKWSHGEIARFDIQTSPTYPMSSKKHLQRKLMR
eukprot:Platyproteum_vivax@DN2473_c0_g1_i1.p1